MATDGRYLITATQVTGDVSIGDASDGQMVQRAWEFAVNQDPEFLSFLDNETTDPANALMYFDTTLFLQGQLMANVFDAKLTLHNETIEFRGGGESLKRTRPAGHSWTLGFTEYVTQDNVLLQQVIAQVLAASGNRRAPAFVFQLVHKSTALASA